MLEDTRSAMTVQRLGLKCTPVKALKVIYFAQLLTQ